MNTKDYKLMYDSLLKAIEIAGSLAALARLINAHKHCTTGFVGVWKERGCMGPSFVIAAEKALQGRIKRWEFRPDIYPKED